MERQEMEAISRQWHEGLITAQEMAALIKRPTHYVQQCGRALRSPSNKTRVIIVDMCTIFDHERWEGAGFAFCPDCNVKL